MVKLLFFCYKLYFFIIIIITNSFSKVLIDKNIKDIFLTETKNDELGLEFKENKLEVVENNESTKHNDEYFIAIEFEFDKINNKYVQKNKTDDNLKNFNFEIIINKDDTYEKNFKDNSNNNIKEYEIEGNCGHLFKIKDINNNEYTIYLTNLFPNVYIFRENKKIVEFRSIYCFGYNIKNEDLFENCKNLKTVKYNNFNKNSRDKLIDYLKKNPNNSIMLHMFLNCTKLINLDLGDFICNCFDFFISCVNLNFIKINNSIDNFFLKGTFCGCKNLKKISFTNTNNIILNLNTFKDCENLEDLNIDNIYLNFGSNSCFENCKKLKNLNLNISNKYLQDYKIGNNLLKGTNLDKLNIITENEFDIKSNIDHLENIVKGAKIKRFTFNNVPINVQDGVNLKEFMLNPIEYLKNNKQYMCEDYKLPEQIEYPKINNNSDKLDINKKNINNDKNKMKCLSCCFKCCCNCC